MILDNRAANMEVWTQRLVLALIALLCVGHLILS